MQTRQLGNSDMLITPLGIGAWAMGGGGWQFAWGPQDDGESIGAIHAALDAGINWIDTAAVYGLGHSEEVVGRALAGRSGRPYVFTKCELVWDEDGKIRNSLKRDSVRREIEASLRRLKLDCVDLYQIHWPQPDEDVEEGWAALAELKKEGKIRWAGVSNFSGPNMERAQKIAPITSLQPPYSILSPEIETDALPYCQANDIGVIVYSPMKSGLLSGKMTPERIAQMPDDDFRKRTISFQEPRLTRNLRLVELMREIGGRHGRTPGEVAIAWTLRHPAVTAAIVGLRSPGQLEGVIGAAGFRLSEGEIGEIARFLAVNAVQPRTFYIALMPCGTIIKTTYGKGVPMKPAGFLRSGGIALGLLAAVGVNWAQQGSPTPTSGGVTTTTPSTPAPSAPSTPSTPSRPTTPTLTPNSTARQPSNDQQANPISEIPRPIFISGKVVLEDGTPPPDLVKIERECGGVVRPEGYADSKGRFSFQVGHNPMAFMDASVRGPEVFGGTTPSAYATFNPSSLPKDGDLDGCAIRASLPGYRSDVIPLMGRRYMDAPELGTIVLHRNGKVEGTTVSITSLLAPKDAQKAFQKGRDAARKNKWQEARKQLETAVGLHPKYAVAWSELGAVLEQLKDVDGARKAYEQALAADPKFVNPYLQLARIELDQRQWQDAADTTSQAIKLDPVNYPNAYVFNSLAEYNLKHLDAAEVSAREALKLDTSHSYPLSDRIMAAILTLRGDLAAAAQYLRSYLKSAPSAGDAALVKQQVQQLERRR